VFDLSAMFEDIICPDPAYTQLKASGVVDVILGKKDIIDDELLSTYCNIEVVDDAREFIRENNSKARSEKTIIREEIIDFSKKCEDRFNDISFSRDYTKILGENPGYLSFLLLGDDVLKYGECGFTDRGSLEKAVTSFCLGERHEFNSINDEWVWRANGNKNSVYRNMHGDLYVSQIDSSGKDYWDQTLFGDTRVFDCMKKVDNSGFGAYQEWSEFLTSLLQYSKKVDMDGIDEIVNWEGTLEEIGGRGGNWTESFGGRRGCEFSARILMDSQLMSSEEKMKKLPLVVNNLRTYTVPFFEDGKLMYLREDEEGDVGIEGKIFEGKKFSKAVEYRSEDLPNAMRGCLKYFARSREMIPAIMGEFLKK
jgi:hypothetical protein